jgi:hypothetical protein
MRRRRSSGLELRKRWQERVEEGVPDITNSSIHQNVATGRKVTTAEPGRVAVEWDQGMKGGGPIVTVELALAWIGIAGGEQKIGEVGMV